MIADIMPAPKTTQAWRTVCGAALQRAGKPVPPVSLVPAVVGRRRSNFNVARRAAAAKAIKAAMPDLTLQEIGDLLGVSHNTVLNYLHDDFKAAIRGTPSWGPLFIVLANALASAGTDSAHMAALRLAEHLKGTP